MKMYLADSSKNVKLKMKKLLLLLIVAIGLNSCSVGDDSNPIAGFAILAIQDVEVAETYPVNESTDILVTYSRPTDCYIFDGFAIEPNGNVFTIGVQAVLMNQPTCLDDSMNSFQVPLEFKPQQTGEFILKFYAGSENDVPQYLEYTITVE